MLEPKGLFSPRQDLKLTEVSDVISRFVEALNQLDILTSNGEVQKAFILAQSLFKQLDQLPTGERTGHDLKKRVSGAYAELAIEINDFPSAIAGFNRMILESNSSANTFPEEVRFAQIKVVILEYLQKNYPAYERAIDAYFKDPNNQDTLNQLPLLPLKAANLERLGFTPSSQETINNFSYQLLSLRDPEFNAVVDQLHEVLQVVASAKNYQTGRAFAKSLLEALEQGRRNINHSEHYLDVLLLSATLEYFSANEIEASYLMDRFNDALDELPIDDSLRITLDESSITLLKKLGRFREAIAICDQQYTRTLDDLDFDSHFTFAAMRAQILFLTGAKEKAHGEIVLALSRIEELLPRHILKAIRERDHERIADLLNRDSEPTLIHDNHEIKDLLVHYRILHEILARFGTAERSPLIPPPDIGTLRTLLTVLGESQNVADELELFQDLHKDASPESLREYLSVVENSNQSNSEESYNSVYQLLRIAVMKTRLDGIDAGEAAFDRATEMYQQLTQGEALSSAPLINLLRGHYYMEREEYMLALSPLIDAQQNIEYANLQISSLGVEIYRCLMECYREVSNEEAAAEFNELHQRAEVALRRLSQ